MQTQREIKSKMLNSMQYNNGQAEHTILLQFSSTHNMLADLLQPALLAISADGSLLNNKRGFFGLHITVFSM